MARGPCIASCLAALAAALGWALLAAASPVGAQTSTTPARDGWSKLEAVSGLVSGVLVATIGALATYIYNNRQARSQKQQAEQERQLQQIQTVASFMPFLGSDDRRQKEAALLCISDLGNPELAAKLGATFRDEGSLDALTRMATSADTATATVALQSLDEIFGTLRRSVVKVNGGAAGQTPQRSGSGFAIGAAHVVTADFVVDRHEALALELSDGIEVPCALVFSDPEHGIAILEVQGTAPPPLPLAHPDTGAPGDEVILLGFGGTGWGTSVGRVSGRDALFDPSVRRPGGLPALVTTLRSEPGYAGAPVLDRRGEVVGLLIARRAGTGGDETLVLPVDEIRHGLVEAGIPFTSAEAAE